MLGEQAFARVLDPSRTSLTRPQGGFLLYLYIRLEVERDDRMSVEVAVCSTVVMNMGLSMEQGLGRHSELYHRGGKPLSFESA